MREEDPAELHTGGDDWTPLHPGKFFFSIFFFFIHSKPEKTPPPKNFPQIEAKTRAEIDEAKRSLRALVGDAYRDVLASADAISAMKRDARRLVAAAGVRTEGTPAAKLSKISEFGPMAAVARTMPSMVSVSGTN